jgi:hypothetical protein
MKLHLNLLVTCEFTHYFLVTYEATLYFIGNLQSYISNL